MGWQLRGQLWSGTTLAKAQRAVVLLSCDPYSGCSRWGTTSWRRPICTWQSITPAIHPYSACSWWLTTSWSGSRRGWRRRWHGPAVRRLAWCAEMAQPLLIGNRSGGRLHAGCSAVSCPVCMRRVACRPSLVQRKRRTRMRRSWWSMASRWVWTDCLFPPDFQASS